MICNTKPCNITSRSLRVLQLLVAEAEFVSPMT